MIRNSLQQGLRLLTLQWIRINSFDILIRFMMVIGNPRLTVHATRHPRNLEEVKITACLVFCQAGNPLRSRAMIPLVPFFFHFILPRIYREQQMGILFRLGPDLNALREAPI